MRTMLIATLVLLLSAAPVGTGTPQSSSTPETAAPPAAEQPETRKNPLMNYSEVQGLPEQGQQLIRVVARNGSGLTSL